jgi:hypothetical protein
LGAGVFTSFSQGIVYGRAERGNKRSSVSPAISEQLMMRDKEAWNWAGFLAPRPVATGGAYFQTVSFLEVAAALSSCDVGVVGCGK